MKLARGFTVIEFMIITAIVLILLLTVVPSTACVFNRNPGPGTKIGQIVRVNEEGLIYKTYEGQLIRGGMTGGSGAFGTVPFDFTIPPALVPACEEAMAKQTEVIIKYNIEAIALKQRTGAGEGAFLISIEPAPKEIK